MANRLFILVSTGQGVANLPPLLEHAQGGDHVQWIESDVARKNQWSIGPTHVLRQMGLVIDQPITVDEVNAPDQVIGALIPFLQKWKTERRQIFVVGNGGNKFTPLGLMQGLRDLSPVMVYGDDAPAVCWLFTEGMDRPPKISQYQRHTLDLPEVLAASGHRIIDPRRAAKFWPGPLASELSAERYGQDRRFTAKLHADHYHWAAARPPAAQLPRYDECFNAIPGGDSARWKNSIFRALRLDGTTNFSQEVQASVYNATLNLAEDAALRLARRNLVAPQQPLGESLERAVARRVHGWLEGNGSSFVQSAWRNVAVGRSGKAAESVVEFDILLVLKNGILWHLECKSAEADPKDLDARILNLQSTGSRLARMAVCMPLLTHYPSEPWFADLHLLHRRLAGRFTIVPFDFPGQPNEYVWRDEARNWERETHSCETIEAALGRCLAQYRPA